MADHLRERPRKKQPTATEEIFDDVKEAIKDGAEKVADKLICLWDDLPTWQRDNQYIISGYRPASASFRKSFQSLGYFHNETINIYTHLLGAIFFMALAAPLYQMLANRYPSATVSDVWAFSSFFIGCGFCLGMSAFYHTVSNHSHKVAKQYNVLDYVGIVALIVGSFVPSVYYGLWCHANLQRVYWTMIGSIGAACAIVSVHPHFRTPKYRPFRAAMFVGMGLSAVIPVLHGLKLYGTVELDNRMGLRWVVLQGFLYIVGAGLYAARIPERWAPGTYDLVGASHQIFHTLVLLAAASHLKGLVSAFDHLHSAGSPKC